MQDVLLDAVDVRSIGSVRRLIGSLFKSSSGAFSVLPLDEKNQLTITATVEGIQCSA